MGQGKRFWIIIGKESLYMLAMSLIACVAALIQTIAKKYVGDYSSFIFSGSNYQYNFVLYACGLLLFVGAAILLYKLILAKDFKKIDEITIPLRIVIWLMLVIWGIVMLAAIVFVLFMCILGLSNNLLPGFCLAVTMFGWPILIVIFLVVMSVKNLIKKRA